MNAKRPAGRAARDDARTIQVQQPPPLPDAPRAAPVLRHVCGGHTNRLNGMLANGAVNAMWLGHALEREERQRLAGATLDLLAAFKPRDAVEGMLAAQAVALHHGAMECFRRAMLPDQPSDIAAKLRRDGARLSQTAAEMVQAIERRRGHGQQTVRVEHVTVQAGGQAIVGAVAPPSLPPGGRDRDEARG